MAFANLFSGLSAMSEDAGSPAKYVSKFPLPLLCHFSFFFYKRDVISSSPKTTLPPGANPATSRSQRVSALLQPRNISTALTPLTTAGRMAAVRIIKPNARRRGRINIMIIEEKPKFMTQEFKDQNTLLKKKFDSHHFQGYNDIIKEACKYYIKGFCINGQSCPYMHNILLPFSCLIAEITVRNGRTKGNCLQEGNCRFSHEPLNDVTEKLTFKSTCLNLTQMQ
uniref:C3H1-type domain-containing protein n=1 Tax=Xiphophorus couchianus TaxID=32473 RepID=A0A3B5LWJ5_9TELE